jgi:uncharacterized membrane protein
MNNVKRKKKASIDRKKGIVNLEDNYESNLPTPEELEKYNNALP